MFLHRKKEERDCLLHLGVWRFIRLIDWIKTPKLPAFEHPGFDAARREIGIVSPDKSFTDAFKGRWKEYECEAMPLKLYEHRRSTEGEDHSVLDEFGIRRPVQLCQIFHLMRAQRDGGAGPLLTSGGQTRFYVCGPRRHRPNPPFRVAVSRRMTWQLHAYDPRHAGFKWEERLITSVLSGDVNEQTV